MYRDISLHILDIAENSFKSEATEVKIYLKKVRGGTYLKVRDNGLDFDKHTLALARKGKLKSTANGGNGLKLLYRNCKGKMRIYSKNRVTEVFAKFGNDIATGNIYETLKSLILMSEQKNIHLIFKVRSKQEFVFDTNEIHDILHGLTIMESEVYGVLTGYIDDGLKGIF